MKCIKRCTVPRKTSFSPSFNTGAGGQVEFSGVCCHSVRWWLFRMDGTHPRGSLCWSGQLPAAPQQFGSENQPPALVFLIGGAGEPLWDIRCCWTKWAWPSSWAVTRPLSFGGAAPAYKILLQKNATWSGIRAWDLLPVRSGCPEMWSARGSC